MPRTSNQRGKLEEMVDATEQEINPDYEAMLEMEARSVSDVADVAANLTMDAVFDFEDMAKASGDKFMAVKPWVGSLLVTPTKPPPMNTSGRKAWSWSGSTVLACRVVATS